MPGLDVNVLVAYAFGIFLIYLAIRILFIPLKYATILVVNSVIGGVALAVINLVGGVFSFHLPLNLVTAPLVGFLGVPGVVLLAVLKSYLGME